MNKKKSGQWRDANCWLRYDTMFESGRMINILTTVINRVMMCGVAPFLYHTQHIIRDLNINIFISLKRA